jgi:hypothetical protein
MPLDKNILKQSILDILNDMKTREEKAEEELATRLADAIDTHIRTIKITYVAGLANGGGPVTGAAQFTIS